MIDENNGYIKLNRFSGNTIQEFNTAMNTLKNEGMQNLILDLRGNPGGYLKASIRLADHFLEDEEMIVYTQGRARPKQVYRATKRGDLENGKLVVLIDEGSASASEIVSGAVQDQDRGLIIGRRSFGKGLVQEPKKLPDGSALRLTVARYYTPTGRSIQKPYEKGNKAYKKEVIERFKHGEFIHKDSIDFADSLKYSTPNGRTVYGGGGIMPDIFIPIDTVLNQSDYFAKIRRNGLINRFALNFVDQYRGEIEENYPSKERFLNNFRVEGAIFRDFVTFIRKNDIAYSYQKMKPIKSFVLNEIKALVGRQLWDDDLYYQISNNNDDAYQKALESINGDAFEKRKLDYGEAS